MRPEIKIEDGKIVLEYSYGIDTNKDGQSSAVAVVAIKIDKAEVIEEAMAKIIASGSLPDFIKNIVGK